MRALEQKKLLTLITAHAFKNIVTEILKAREVGGYTVVDATGVGAFGVQSGALDSDSNVLIYVILSEARLNLLLEDLDALMTRSYRIKVIVTDISILPRKKSPGGTSG
ncbi:hypothetical protein [Hydrogenophaga sp.]|uniref:P-II family nitrogen regulator n=1 Tax=Hydrogenophaga sp. TaxID=1904254 RepID=UPI0019CDCF13|nr:hypothetical protein [Hydrogenophaga sp.]MBD3892362.1 transcriptional regulator [Hydrogenophaga sp.]